MKTEDNYIDKAIEKASEDRFGYVKLAGLIASSVKSHSSASSITLGLEGSWGSGKTSMLTILREQIEKESRESGEGDGIGTVVISFSPWLITNRAALIEDFFAQIRSAMASAKGKAKRDGLRRKLHDVGEKIDEFGWANILATATTVAATVSDPTFTSAIAAGKALEALKKSSGSTHGLESQHGKIVKKLSKISKSDSSFKILVLIDDLDRLEPSEALEVVRLVKAVADFPTIVYLLAYDESLLARAIQTATGIEDGNAYLEKIIQFSFRMPPFEPFQLRAWLKDELRHNFEGEADFSSDRADIVLGQWASRLLSTPRDVKRVLYATNTLWPNIRDNADLLDLVWLQMLSLKASDGERNLYSWVALYLQSLDAFVLGGSTTDAKGQCKALRKTLISLGFENKETEDLIAEGFISSHCLEILLAGVDHSDLSEESSNWTHKFYNEQLHSFREEKRLSSPWHWRYYFALSPPSHALTDSEWEVFFSAARSSESELKGKLGRLIDISGDNRPDIADQLLERLTYLSRHAKLECPVVWTNVLMPFSEDFAELSKPDAFGFRPKFRMLAGDFVGSVIRSLSGDERKEAIEAVFKVNPVSSLSCYFVLETYSREPESFGLTKAELEQAKNWQIEKYRALTVGEFQALYFPLDLLSAWKLLTSQDEPSKLVSRAFKTDDGLISTLEKLRINASSEHNWVPYISENDIAPFTDLSVLKSRLEEISKSSSPLAPKAGFLLNNCWRS